MGILFVTKVEMGIVGEVIVGKVPNTAGSATYSPTFQAHLALLIVLGV